MPRFRTPLCVLTVLAFVNLLPAQPMPKIKDLPSAAGKVIPIIAPAAAGWALENNKLSLTGLAPAKLFTELCHYRYRASTASEECQAFIDQGLGYFYSYVWIEAARSFETALKYDSQCALAYWGLSKSMEKWGKGDHTAALKKAQELAPKASHREQLLITARCQEKGIAPNTTPEDRKKKAQATLDELLTIYEDDEEGWFARAQVSEGNAAVPYYKALLRINPIHPGASHELVHFYENFRRPALGWPFAEAYMASSPGIPHAYHMQAHLAMRIGKWDKTTDRSWRAFQVEKEYHILQGVKPSEDHQFNHHMETLTRSLVHDGRFSEARQIKKEAEGYKYSYVPEWFRMFVGEHAWDEAEKLVAAERKKNKEAGSYYAAVLYLDKGETDRAAAEVDVLRQLAQQKKSDKRLEMRLWEVQGRLLCQSGSGDAGLKLIRRTVDKTKNDYFFHAWGGGAYYMENWGMAALECGNAAEAEEAFLEALAHDAASVRAALGLQAMCERLGRRDEAYRYEVLARRCWSKADLNHVELMRQDMQRRASRLVTEAASR